MYMPRLFNETDPDPLYDLIEADSFGTLVVADGDNVEIAHLPFLAERGERLRAHVAAGNRIAKLAEQGCRATAIFHGPHAYVSPRWYEHPTEQVPTWNYAVVHVHGQLAGPADRGELLALLDKLSAKHESDAPAPWSPGMLAPALVDGLATGIVGFELKIERVEGKFKLSQNRSKTDQIRVRDALAQRGVGDDRRVADMMKLR